MADNDFGGDVTGDAGGYGGGEFGSAGGGNSIEGMGNSVDAGAGLDSPSMGFLESSNTNSFGALGNMGPASVLGGAVMAATGSPGLGALAALGAMIAQSPAALHQLEIAGAWAANNPQLASMYVADAVSIAAGAVDPGGEQQPAWSAGTQ